jgi:hypothetical protein
LGDLNQFETSAKGAFSVAAAYDRRKTPIKMQTRRSQSAAKGVLQRSQFVGAGFKFISFDAVVMSRSQAQPHGRFFTFVFAAYFLQ